MAQGLKNIELSDQWGVLVGRSSRGNYLLCSNSHKINCYSDAKHQFNLSFLGFCLQNQSLVGTECSDYSISY